MSIRDRGNIKWTSLILDEQQLAEINTLILESMEYKFPLSFTIYKNKRLVVIQGNIHFIDINKQEFRIKDFHNHLHIFKTASIKDVQKYDLT